MVPAALGLKVMVLKAMGIQVVVVIVLMVLMLTVRMCSIRCCRIGRLLLLRPLLLFARCLLAEVPRVVDSTVVWLGGVLSLVRMVSPAAEVKERCILLWDLSVVP